MRSPATMWIVLLCSAIASPARGTEIDPPLATMVYREFPQLDPRHPDFSRLSDWKKVRMLLDFTYRHTAYSNNVKSQSYEAGNACILEMGQGKRSLAEAYAFFNASRGGVVCGGATQMSVALFRAFGFDCWYIGHGFHPPTPQGSSFSHAETLVRIRYGANDEALLVLLDSSANVAYTDADGSSPLDYFEILRRLAAGEDERLGTVVGCGDGIDRGDPSTVCFADETAGRTPADFAGSWNIDQRRMRVIDQGQGCWRFVSPRTVEKFELLGDDLWKPQLVREGRPGKTVYLHLYPFAVSGSPDGEKILAQAKEIVKTAPQARQ